MVTRKSWTAACVAWLRHAVHQSRSSTITLLSLMAVVAIVVSDILPSWSNYIGATSSSAQLRGVDSNSARTPLNEPLKPFSTAPKTLKEAMEWIVAARNGTRAAMVQIGTNNGRLDDPVYAIYGSRMDEWHRDWIALLAEPQPELMNRAAVLHSKAKGWAFYNGAFAPSNLCVDGTVRLCETKTPGQGLDTAELGDVTIEEVKTQGLVNRVQENQSNCEENHKEMHIKTRLCESSFGNLLEHASPEFRQRTFALEASNPVHTQYYFDLLLIDVEGYDFDVLKAILNSKHAHPHCVHYELMGLGSEENKQASQEFVRSKGYKPVVADVHGKDVLACRVSSE